MSSFRERWRHLKRDAYEAGYKAGAREARSGRRDSPLKVFLDMWRFAWNSEFVKEEQFRANDPWFLKQKRRALFRFTSQLSRLLEVLSEAILRVAEWVLVIALFRYLALQTEEVVFDWAATTLYLALIAYFGRHLLPLLIHRPKAPRWLAIVISMILAFLAVAGGALIFAGIGDLANLVAANQNLL